MITTDTETIEKIKIPPMWKVIIHNDDYTPVDFVISLINKIFNKSWEEAVRLTYLVHNKGKADVGIFTKEIAVIKVSQVKEMAEQHGHPLLATMEEA